VRHAVAVDSEQPSEGTEFSAVAAADRSKYDSSFVSTNDLKKDLLRKCAVCDRGYGATTGERELIQSLVTQLAAQSPTMTPAAGIEGSDPIAVRGAWRLVYTSAIDVLSLAANPVSSIGGVYQNILDDGIITNIIDVLNPRALSILPPTLNLDSTLRLKVQTRARERGPSRVGLVFEKITVSPQKFLGNDVSFLPAPTIDLPAFNSAASAESPAYFDIEYLDDDLLVIKQNTAAGVDGGLFIQVKVDPTREPVPF